MVSTYDGEKASKAKGAAPNQVIFMACVLCLCAGFFMGAVEIYEASICRHCHDSFRTFELAPAFSQQYDLPRTYGWAYLLAQGRS